MKNIIIFILMLGFFFSGCVPTANLGVNTNLGGFGNANINMDSNGRIGVGANANLGH